MVSIPPIRGMNEVGFKTNLSQKHNIDWDIVFPDVNFEYSAQKNGKDTVFKAQFKVDALLEKFNIKKEANDQMNVDNLADKIAQYFNDNKVTIEDWQQKKYYALEFKDNGKTLFKAYLKDD